MPKTKGQTFPYSFGNETKKRFGIVTEFVLLRTDCFHWVQNLLSWTKQKCAFFDGANWGTNSDVLVSFLLDVGTFVERLWNVCSFTVLTLLPRRPAFVSKA